MHSSLATTVFVAAFRVDEVMTEFKSCLLIYRMFHVAK